MCRVYILEGITCIQKEDNDINKMVTWKKRKNFKYGTLFKKRQLQQIQTDLR